MKNLNPKHNPITTIIAVVLITVGLGTLLMPIFLEPKKDLEEWVKWVLLLGGLGFLFAPDKMLGLVMNALSGITKTKNTP